MRTLLCHTWHTRWLDSLWLKMIQGVDGNVISAKSLPSNVMVSWKGSGCVINLMYGPRVLGSPKAQHTRRFDVQENGDEDGEGVVTSQQNYGQLADGSAKTCAHIGTGPC